MSDFNTGVIEEFRANAGKVGGYFEGKDLLLLTTIGAKSGQPRTSPVNYSKNGDQLVIVASKAGAPSNPDWYWNLKANPEATVEVGTETFKAKATEVEGAERDRLFAAHVAQYPGFAEYAEKTQGVRTIPIFVLDLESKTSANR